MDKKEIIQKTIGKILKLRLVFLVLILIITVFLGIRASRLRLYDDPNEWPPKTTQM